MPSGLSMAASTLLARPLGAPEEGHGRILGLVPDGADSPRPLARAAELDQARGPGQGAADPMDHLDQATGQVPSYL